MVCKRTIYITLACLLVGAGVLLCGCAVGKFLQVLLAEAGICGIFGFLYILLKAGLTENTRKEITYLTLSLLLLSATIIDFTYLYCISYNKPFNILTTLGITAIFIGTVLGFYTLEKYYIND